MQTFVWCAWKTTDNKWSLTLFWHISKRSVVIFHRPYCNNITSHDPPCVMIDKQRPLVIRTQSAKTNDLHTSQYMYYYVFYKFFFAGGSGKTFSSILSVTYTQGLARFLAQTSNHKSGTKSSVIMCQERNRTCDCSMLIKMQTQTTLYTCKQCSDWKNLCWLRQNDGWSSTRNWEHGYRGGIDAEWDPDA